MSLLRPTTTKDESNKPSEKSVETSTSTISIHMEEIESQQLQQRQDGVVPTGYEIRINPSSSTEKKGVKQQQQENRGVDTSLHVLTEEEEGAASNSGDDGREGNEDTMITTTTRAQSALLSTPTTSKSPVLSAIISSAHTDTENNVQQQEEEEEEYVWSPPRHIYALRQIIVEDEMEGGGGGDDDGVDDDEDVVRDQLLLRDESNNERVDVDSTIPPPPPQEAHPDTLHHTKPKTVQHKSRLISSQMVTISEYENAKLEKSSTGCVLCSKWEDNEPKFGQDLARGKLDNGNNSADAVVMSGARVCTTKTENDEKIVVVPYSLARRRMGCHCVENVEKEEEGGGVSATKSRKKWSGWKEVYNACRIVKRTLFCQTRQHNSRNTSTMGGEEGVEEEYCKHCNVFGTDSSPTGPTREKRMMTMKKKRRNRSALTLRNVGESIYGEESVLNNSATPINDILSIDSSLGIYICESGLTAAKCQEIIDAAEHLAYHKGAWSAYTYAKQTLGCKEYDELAEASGEPVMTACATVRERLEELWAATGDKRVSDDENEPLTFTPGGDNSRKEVKKSNKKPQLVLDIREPHVVKYDLSRMERRKLDMHTDRSVWTFIIALSEGRGHDYSGGGTFFEKLNATVHLQRGQMIIFRGKLRHRGVKITYGMRYLLVGFLVEQKSVC